MNIFIIQERTRMKGKEPFNKIEYNNEYIKNNKDRINFVMPKGTKDEIKAYAKSAGMSASEWINEAIKEKMQRQDESFIERVTNEKIED